MGYTKKQFSDLLISTHSGGGTATASKFHRTEVYKMTESALGSLLGMQYLNMWLAGDKNINGDWITPFPYIPVKKDASRADYYSDLPVEIISLTNERGLVSIQKMKGDSDEFVLLAPGQWDCIKNLETGYVKNKIFAYLENNKVRYKNFADAETCGLLLIKMVCGGSKVEEDQFLPIPAEMEAQLIEMVGSMMDRQGASTQKKINDGNPNVMQ